MLIPSSACSPALIADRTRFFGKFIIITSKKTAFTRRQIFRCLKAE
jgi:hypothetical protein